MPRTSLSSAFKAHISLCELKLLVLEGMGIPLRFKRKKKTRRHMIKYKKKCKKKKKVPPNSSQECVFDVLKKANFWSEHQYRWHSFLYATMAW